VLQRAADALLEAIRDRDTSAVSALLCADASQRERGGPGGETLVLYACYVGAAALAPVLRGVRPYDACEAAAIGDLTALNAALDRDADLISRRSSDGWTPLHLAAFFGRDECTAYLIDNGAPLDAHSTNAIRNTPLHAALAGAGNHNVVRRLLFAGADVHARGEHDIQPLHIAASRGDQPMVVLLLSREADPAAKMADGVTPADMAQQRGFAEVEAKLRGRGEGG